MKHLHKFASVLLALVMALSLMVPAFASEGEPNPAPQETATLTVPDLSKHSYTAYQIFSGTQAESEGALADVQWGSGIDSTSFLAKLVALGYKEIGSDDTEKAVFTESMTAAQVAEGIAKYASKSAQANAIAQAAYEARKTEPDDAGIKLGEETELDTGYYVIVDTTTFGDGQTNTVVNAALLQLTDDITIETKVSVPSVDKEVQENSTGNYGDAADYSIGDDVPFQFNSVVPDMTQFETYKYVFHDTMVEGLTFNKDSVEISINGGTPISETLYKVVTKEEDENLDCTFEIRFENLKSAVATERAVAGNPITITFTAKLNEKAVVGSMGNSNKVKLEYSNNPNDDGNGNPPTGETPEDEVLVFTYGLNPTKVDANDTEKELKDAEFHLSRKITDEEGNEVTVWAVVDATSNKITGWVKAEVGATGYVAADAEGNLNGVAYAGSTLKSDEQGLFTVLGLDAGTYELLETKAPAGYNTPATPFTVTIESTLVPADKGGKTKPTYKDLSAEITINNNTANFTEGKDNNGVLEGKITNASGATLPETGGTGTTIFYVVGGLLTVGAVVLLVTKKRMSVDSDK